jgi:hypothetical protein
LSPALCDLFHLLVLEWETTILDEISRDCF